MKYMTETHENIKNTSLVTEACDSPDKAVNLTIIHTH